MNSHAKKLKAPIQMEMSIQPVPKPNIFDDRVSDAELASWASTLLAPRELTILRMIGAGRVSKQIAHDLGISQRTIDCHRFRICSKLGLRHLAEQVVLGWRIRGQRVVTSGIDNVHNSGHN